MAFTIPDNDESLAPDPQSVWMQTDIDALVAGDGGSGVISGGAVTAQGTPDMTVAVSAGEALLGTTLITIGAGNVTVTAADATKPRIDLIRVDNTGTKGITAGSPARNPKAPALPANNVLLAMVYVPANDTTIATNQIIDKRVILARRLYTLPLASSILATAVDGTTYFFGSRYALAPDTLATVYRTTLQHYGRIVGAVVDLLVLGTLGTTEAATLSIRVNNTTDYQVSAAVLHDAAIARFSNAAMSVPIVPNDFIEMKIVMPTFATNPTNVLYSVSLLIEVYGL
jgi:hypothetical protein